MIRTFARAYRDLAHVPRWLILRQINGQSIAEHQYYVTLYAIEIAHQINWDPYRERTTQLLYYSMVHDASDAFTGDWPGPAKREAIYDRDKFDEWINRENEYRFDLWSRPEVQEALHDAEIKSIIKTADLLDEAMYLAGELQMGNSSVREMYRTVRDRLKWSILKLPAESETLDILRGEIFGALDEQRNTCSETVHNDSDLADQDVYHQGELPF